jgi:hypothetical protein
MSKFIFIFILSTQTLFAQTYTLLEYRYDNKKYSEIPALPFPHDSLNTATPYHVGQFSGNPLAIDTTAPAEQPGTGGSRFTNRSSTDLLDPSLSYPLTTAVELFRVQDGVSIPLCSGSMVGPDAVLSAAHCVVILQKNETGADSVLVCPAFQNGKVHPRFGCSLATHAYWIKDWKIFDHDLALLKIAAPLGYQTGWLGIGYEKAVNTILQAPYLKLCYPNSPFPGTTLPFYNGDTLFFMRLRVNRINKSRLEVSGLQGIPGESGSPIIHIGNTNKFTVHGVLSLSNNYSHLSFDRKLYSTFKYLLDPIPVNTSHPMDDNAPIQIYPNPSNGIFWLHAPSMLPLKVNIADAQGRMLQTIAFTQSPQQIDLSELNYGYYFLTFTTLNQTYTQQILITP